MKCFKSALMMTLGYTCLAGSVYAQQPPDNNPSDIYGNTAIGSNVMPNINTNSGAGAQDNSGFGDYALWEATTGCCNTAMGYASLQSVTTGSFNSAFGVNALQDSTGDYNSAFGTGALTYNNVGNNNTAVGYSALLGQNNGFPVGGNDNTAVGADALYSNKQNQNTAVGSQSLHANTNGTLNTASGFQSLYHSTTGSNNTAAGANALYGQHGMTGSNNTAVGVNALQHVSTGDNNIAYGYQSGLSVTTGSHNIDIGNEGAETDNGIIRIGRPGIQSATYISGIDTNVVTGAAVYVTSSGELGVLASSERYKTAIEPLDDDADRLQLLRPVSFHLKNDPAGSIQYGLIAEEVNKVYPELVIHDAAGNIQGVRYDELAPLLLKEVQQQRRELADVAQLRQQVAELKKMNEAMQAALIELQTQRARVAMR